MAKDWLYVHNPKEGIGKSCLFLLCCILIAIMASCNNPEEMVEKEVDAISTEQELTADEFWEIVVQKSDQIDKLYRGLEDASRHYGYDDLDRLSDLSLKAALCDDPDFVIGFMCARFSRIKGTYYFAIAEVAGELAAYFRGYQDYDVILNDTIGDKSGEEMMKKGLDNYTNTHDYALDKAKKEISYYLEFLEKNNISALENVSREFIDADNEFMRSHGVEFYGVEM
ncbi:MAG: hypothetical protein HDR46_05725 [Bacteroides sp.]|nr:hypothetical protein [Bacteroides sp.]